MAEPAIRKAITVLDMLSRDPETVRLAELRMKQILDERSMLQGAKEEGIGEGVILARREDILDNLNDIDNVPEDIKKLINNEKNIDTLKKWVKISARVNNIEEFKDKIKQ